MPAHNRFAHASKYAGRIAILLGARNTCTTIVISAEMVGVLQTLISRHKNPIDIAVLSVTQIHSGEAYNVLPGDAVIRGTGRTFSTQVLDDIENNMCRIAETLPQVHGGSGELHFYRAYPPLVSWDEQTDFAMQVAIDAFGSGRGEANLLQNRGAEGSFSIWKKCRAANFF